MTIEEMRVIKEQYRKDILELEIKMSVVDDFIAYEESKVSVEPVEEEVAEELETNYEEPDIVQ